MYVCERCELFSVVLMSLLSKRNAVNERGNIMFINIIIISISITRTAFHHLPEKKRYCSIYRFIYTHTHTNHLCIFSIFIFIFTFLSMPSFCLKHRFSHQRSISVSWILFMEMVERDCYRIIIGERFHMTGLRGWCPRNRFMMIMLEVNVQVVDCRLRQ